jgi:hypothetical protein
MVYNHTTHNAAPLPSGALPTQAELNELARRARRQRAVNILDNIRQRLID